MTAKTKKNPFLKENQSIESIGIKPFRTARYTKSQKILLAGIALISLALVGSSLIRMKSRQSGSVAIQNQEETQQPLAEYPAVTSQPVEQPTPIPTKESFRAENKNSASGDLFKHYTIINTFDKMGYDKSYRALTALCHSSSPLIAANACYNLAVINHAKGYYLEAFRLAVAARNLVDFVQFDGINADELKIDCKLLALNSLSHHVLSLNADDNVEYLSLISKESDFFENLTEQQAIRAASSGISDLSTAAQNPIIKKLEDAETQNRYAILCHNLDLESLLIKLASISRCELRFEGFNGSEELKKRPVTLNCRTAELNELIESAVHSAGFLVEFEQSANALVVTVINSLSYHELSVHLDMLNRHATDSWVQFLLQSDSTNHNGLAHTTLGLLYRQNEQYSQAITEFQLVANTFPQTSLAPVALLYSAETKRTLANDISAKEDLARLIEQYPSSGLIANAYLSLAEISFETADYERATTMYKKIFLTYEDPDIKALAAYRVAQCLHSLSDYDAVLRWLKYYFDLDGVKYNTYYQKALLEMGNTNLQLRQYPEAKRAFLKALEFELPTEDYPVAVFGVTEALMKANDLAPAMGILENIKMWQLTPAQAIRAIQLKADIYYRIGLSQKAIAILAEKIDYLSDAKLRTNVILQLSDYLMETNKPQRARQLLAQCIVRVDDLEQIREVNRKLADASLMLSDYDTVISICSKLLAEELPSELRRHLQKTLAKAYESKNDYEKTALVLLGKIPPLDQDNGQTYSLKTSALIKTQ